MDFHHISVLPRETIDSLNIRPDGIYVDGTLGGGGHASLVAAKLGEGGRLIGIDQDADAIRAAGERLKPFGDKVTVVRDNYVNLPTVLDNLGIPRADGIYLDLGVSSYQLDNAERGFSYMEDAPLDMRMDRRSARTAANLVNEESEAELARIIRVYGEDRFSNQIARRIVETRAKKPIETTGELAALVKRVIPMRLQKTGGHPAMRTFQALRIALNGELTVLEQAIDEMILRLQPGGRLSIITFHSLEDRIVKEGFRRNASPCTCPPDFPICVCGKKSRGRVVTGKPIVPTAEEVAANPRSRSAKLRVFALYLRQCRAEAGTGGETAQPEGSQKAARKAAAPRAGAEAFARRCVPACGRAGNRRCLCRHAAWLLCAERGACAAGRARAERDAAEAR